VIHRQRADMRRSLRGLQREGFRYVYVLDSVEAVESVQIERRAMTVAARILS
jgi:protein phosphatase